MNFSKQLLDIINWNKLTSSAKKMTSILLITFLNHNSSEKVLIAPKKSAGNILFAYCYTTANDAGTW